MLKAIKFIMLSSLLFAPVFAHATLKLKDFKGDYVTTIATTGGTPDGVPPSGVTVSGVMQISIDPNGNGTVNFDSELTFIGPSFIGSHVANASAVSTNDGTAHPRSFSVSITDAQRGCGQIVTTSQDGTSNSISDFVAIQNEDGNVVKFIQNPIDNPTPGAFIIVSERQ